MTTKTLKIESLENREMFAAVIEFCQVYGSECLATVSENHGDSATVEINTQHLIDTDIEISADENDNQIVKINNRIELVVVGQNDNENTNFVLNLGEQNQVNFDGLLLGFATINATTEYGASVDFYNTTVSDDVNVSSLGNLGLRLNNSNMFLNVTTSESERNHSNWIDIENESGVDFRYSGIAGRDSINVSDSQLYSLDLNFANGRNEVSIINTVVSNSATRIGSEYYTTGEDINIDFGDGHNRFELLDSTYSQLNLTGEYLLTVNENNRDFDDLLAARIAAQVAEHFDESLVADLAIDELDESQINAAIFESEIDFVNEQLWSANNRNFEQRATVFGAVADMIDSLVADALAE